LLLRDALLCKARSCDHMSSVCLSVHQSVTLGDQDHIGWKSWKLIVWTISPTSLLFIIQRSSTYSQGNMGKFWGENIRSTFTSIKSGWTESTESHVILGGGVALWLFTFAIAQLSCLITYGFTLDALTLCWFVNRKVNRTHENFASLIHSSLRNGNQCYFSFEYLVLVILVYRFTYSCTYCLQCFDTVV